MEKNSTKQEILRVSLDLFSTYGFEATPISKIAEMVGIKKASLYSHFPSKQAILDSLIAETYAMYEKRSIFATANWDDPTYTADKINMTCDDLIKMIAGQVNYIVHDPIISKSRKMLTIEQFQNQQMKDMQTKQNYTDVMNFFKGLIQFLIKNGKISGDDIEIMAAELCLPVSVWINLCDREPSRQKEITELIERHVKHFLSIHQAKL